ncbi:MAG: class I fructose-bisphosphate aldolase [Parachlamydiaceae bacterium]|nr:class I fructose-bisphosphate aldolase [Parachlamydiaceae bacterium]
MSERIREILSYYKGENPGVLTNLARLLNHGRLGGTGRMIILPVDQGFEHGPGRSFAPNPPAYDPNYHFQLAIDAKLNGYASLLGFLEAGAADFAGQIPLILKVNSHDLLHPEKDPMGAQTASVGDALRLGCVAIGYTIYPGTIDRRIQYEQLRELIKEAKSVGLPTIVWAYPRGGGLSKEGETALDVIAYAAQIAAQLGAHVIKTKLPTAHIEFDEARKVYESQKIPLDSLKVRVHHVIQSAFNGKRIVIFSGGAKEDDAAFFEDVRAIRDGGGFGSIIGRNSFQRDRTAALKFLDHAIQIYSGKEK